MTITRYSEPREIRDRAKQLHADALHCYEFLVGVGTLREGAEAAACRKTADYLLWTHGWDLERVSAYKADHDERKRQHPEGCPPAKEVLEKRERKKKATTARAGEDARPDIDARYLRVLGVLGWNDPIRADASDEQNRVFCSEINAKLAEICARMDAKAAYGEDFLREEAERVRAARESKHPDAPGCSPQIAIAQSLLVVLVGLFGGYCGHGLARDMARRGEAYELAAGESPQRAPMLVALATLDLAVPLDGE